MTEDALMNTYGRIGASALTWPVEKSKLLYQGNNNRCLKSVATSLASLSLRTHVMGMLSSCTQRGGSAFLMFYTQANLYQFTNGVTRHSVTDQALAGALGGAMSAPFHTCFELIKVRGHIPCVNACFMSLRPMMLRHAVFDGTFFLINAGLAQHEYSAGRRFAAAAATASFTNLLFDVWKTRQMAQFPRPVRFLSVVSSLRPTTFLSNYVVKGTDLTINWFVVGCLKEAFFSGR